MATQTALNVLILLADQMRGDALGCAGHPLVRTPNIDRLAELGVRFANAYTPDPICVPARASLVTGNYPIVCTGTKANHGTIRSDQVKMPELFARHGYRTYAVGKLHFLPYSRPGTPRLLHGFQEALLTEEGRILEQFAPRSDVQGLEDYHDYLASVGWGGYERAHGVGNNDVHPATSPLPAEHYVDAWVARSAIELLRRHLDRARDSPFFLFAGFPRPHAPYDPPRPYDALYDPRDVPPPFHAADERGRCPTKQAERIARAWGRFPPQLTQLARAHYLAQVTFQDEQIGRILSFLDESRLAGNTIVLYAADHGDLMGDFGLFAKQCFYRGSANIPLIVRCPGATRAGSVSEELVGLQDILPTLAALCGIPLSSDGKPARVHGMDLSGLLRGSGQRTGTESSLPRRFYVSACGDDPRQLYMVADRRWKYCYSQVGGVEELYDLREDPCELANLAGRPPAAGALRTMRSRLRSWLTEMGDTSVLTEGGFAASENDPLPEPPWGSNTLGWRWY